ncbi:MAG: hypothetical protein RL172_3180 [Bacteroidota bacterium]
MHPGAVNVHGNLQHTGTNRFAIQKPSAAGNTAGAGFAATDDGGRKIVAIADDTRRYKPC